MFCTLFFSNKNKKTPEGALIEVQDLQWIINNIKDDIRYVRLHVSFIATDNTIVSLM